MPAPGGEHGSRIRRDPFDVDTWANLVGKALESSDPKDHPQSTHIEGGSSYLPMPNRKQDLLKSLQVGEKNYGACHLVTTTF